MLNFLVWLSEVKKWKLSLGFLFLSFTLYLYFPSLDWLLDVSLVAIGIFIIYVLLETTESLMDRYYDYEEV